MIRRLLHLAPFVALPWTWFLVRDLHPAADVVALGMPVLVAVAVAGCLVSVLIHRRPTPLASAASWVVFGFVVIVGPWTPRSAPPPVDAVRIVAANTYGSRPYPPSIGMDIAAQAPDVVVVSEVSPGVEEELGARFASTVRADAGRSGRSDVAVFSDLPMELLDLPDGLGGSRGLRVRVDGPAGPFVLYGLHLPPPRARPDGYPDVSVRRHHEIVRALRDAVARERLPVVVAGDLNLVDRASGYRSLTRVLDDAMRSTWLRPTSLRAGTLPLLARIDHVMVPESWCSTDASVFTLTGSDHRGVAATTGPCP